MPADLASLIEGSQKITDTFSYWPSFHDAEVIDLHFWRGEIDLERDIYIFPILTVKLHAWELTDIVNEHGHLVCRQHMMVTLRFHHVGEFRMEGFNHQNAIFELAIEHKQRASGPSPFFAVEFKTAFGMGAALECLRVEVVEALPCTDEGEPVALAR